MKRLWGDPLYWSWASNSNHVRQNVGDFVASDPGVGSDVVDENSMYLSSLLKHVRGLAYQARGMLGSLSTINDTGRTFTVREHFSTEPRGHRAAGGQGPEYGCELSHRCRRTRAPNINRANIGKGTSP